MQASCRQRANKPAALLEAGMDLAMQISLSLCHRASGARPGTHYCIGHLQLVARRADIRALRTLRSDGLACGQTPWPITG